MSVTGLDHVNIRTTQLAEMVRFYEEVLGLASGPRPGFSFPGAWLYCGPQAVVHLIEVPTPPQPSTDSGLEHFAFSGAGTREDFKARLTAQGVEHWEGEPPGTGLTQVNFRDPDGHHIHVDFAD